MNSLFIATRGDRCLADVAPLAALDASRFEDVLSNVPLLPACRGEHVARLLWNDQHVVASPDRVGQHVGAHGRGARLEQPPRVLGPLVQDLWSGLRRLYPPR